MKLFCPYYCAIWRLSDEFSKIGSSLRRKAFEREPAGRTKNAFLKSMTDLPALSHSHHGVMDGPESRGIMIGNTSPGRSDRINAKNLNQQFMQEMIQGLLAI